MGCLEGNAMAAWTILGDTENPPLATVPHIWPGMFMVGVT
jgi:hypothetical protein